MSWMWSNQSGVNYRFLKMRLTGAESNDIINIQDEPFNDIEYATLYTHCDFLSATQTDMKENIKIYFWIKKKKKQYEQNGTSIYGDDDKRNICHVHDQLNHASKDGQLKLCYAFD